MRTGFRFREARATGNATEWSTGRIHNLKELADYNGRIGREMAGLMKTGRESRKRSERLFFAIAASLPVSNPIRPIHKTQELAEFDGRVGREMANIVKTSPEGRRRSEEIFSAMNANLGNRYQA